MKKDDSVYLHHILAEIERIEEYSEGVFLQEFLKIGIIQDGVARQLEIIGESSRDLSARQIDKGNGRDQAAILAARPARPALSKRKQQAIIDNRYYL